MNNAQKAYRLKPEVVFQPMDDDAIIVSLDSENIYKLNMTGTRVVKLIEEQHPLDEIITILSEEFAVDQNELVEEVIQLIGELQTAGLIEESSESQ